MQIVVGVSWKVAEYIEKEAHAQMRRPECCPNCKARSSLEALGYYQRNITDEETGKVRRLNVRRFLCLLCWISVSLLPGFCHPYHLLCHQTQSDYFVEKKYSQSVLRWEEQLKVYRKRFKEWLPELNRALGGAYGPAPPIYSFRIKQRIKWFQNYH